MSDTHQIKVGLEDSDEKLAEKVAADVDDIIDLAFPEIADEDVEVVLDNLNDRVALATFTIKGNPEKPWKRKKTDKHFTTVITLSLSWNHVFSIPESALKGIIAHELCHCVEYKTMSLVQILIYKIMYAISSGYYRKVERRVDTETIKRGFGKELLDFHIYLSKRYRGAAKTYGLTMDEIKAAISRDCSRCSAQLDGPQARKALGDE